MGDNRAKAPSQPSGKKKRRGPVSVADLVPGAIGDLCRRRGFAGAELITWWAEIVGAERALQCEPDGILWPRRIDDPDAGQEAATLVLRVAGAHALFVQQDAPRIIERVNIFLGYPAIGRIKILQRPIVRSAPKQRRKIEPLAAADEAALAEKLRAIDDDDLRAALTRLGRAVRAEHLTKS